MEVNKKPIVKIEHLSKHKNSPKKSMTPAHERLLAEKHMRALQEIAERRANGLTLPEDDIEEYTLWL